MWPFEKFKVIEKDLGFANSRIKDLERQVENLMGANQVLTQELARANNKEEYVLEKLFDFTGVNKQHTLPAPTLGKAPINIGKRATPWPELREQLEKKAYWEQQAKRNGSGIGIPYQESIDKLEKEVMGDAGQSIPIDEIKGQY